MAAFLKEDSPFCLTRAISRTLIGLCYTPLSLGPRDADTNPHRGLEPFVHNLDQQFQVPASGAHSKLSTGRNVSQVAKPTGTTKPASKGILQPLVA